MNFLDIAKNRYTTKVYQNKKITDKQVEDLKEILRLAPSSINSQPWKFVIVSDEKTKQELVVFLGFDDVRKFEEQIRKNLPEPAQNYYHQNLLPMGDEAIKVWLHKQVYIALGYFLSACASMNIDSTPMEGIQTQKYDAILQQDGYKTLFAVAIGHRDPQDSNQPEFKPKSRLPLEEVILHI